LASKDRYRVIRRQAGFRDFVRLYLAVRRQPQFQQYTGSITWLLYLASLPPAYVFGMLKGLPELILVEEDGRLMSGIMITRDGWLTNFVSFGDTFRKPRAALVGYAELQKALDQPGYRNRTLKLRTAAYNRSQILALQRLGYVVTDRPSYMVTARLGPLRFSRPRRTAPKSRLFHVEQQVVLERRALARADRSMN
jgi:hypothetical protein